MKQRILYPTLLATVLLLLPAAHTWADIYKLVDKRGVIHLTDKPNDPQYRNMTKVRLTKTVKLTKYTSKRHQDALARSNYTSQPTHYNKNHRKNYFPTVRSAAQEYDIDEKLLDAIIMVESAYNPNAVSPKGATGLMQLMPETGARYGAVDRLDPEQNIHAGARYMRKLLNQFNNTRLALAAYNAGEGAVAKYGQTVPPYTETQNYVEKVLALYMTQ